MLITSCDKLVFDHYLNTSIILSESDFSDNSVRSDSKHHKVKKIKTHRTEKRLFDIIIPKSFLKNDGIENNNKKENSDNECVRSIY